MCNKEIYRYLWFLEEACFPWLFFVQKDNQKAFSGTDNQGKM